MQSKSTMRMTMRGTWFATMSHAADLGTFIVHFQSARTSSWFANSRQSSVTKVCSNCLAKAWNLWVELWTVTVIFLCWSQISQREREREHSGIPGSAQSYFTLSPSSLKDLYTIGPPCQPYSRLNPNRHENGNPFETPDGAVFLSASRHIRDLSATDGWTVTVGGVGWRIEWFRQLPQDKTQFKKDQKKELNEWPSLLQPC